MNSDVNFGGGGNTFADISLDPTELSHHSVEEQKVVRAHLQQLKMDFDKYKKNMSGMQFALI